MGGGPVRAAPDNEGKQIEAIAKSAPPSMACRRCGECCRRYQVHLDLDEARDIAGRLGLGLEEFRRRYADPRWPGSSSILVRHGQDGCLFLKPAQDGTQLCDIHDFKPSVCRRWMPATDKLECQAGLARRTGDSDGSTDSLAGDRRTEHADI